MVGGDNLSLKFKVSGLDITEKNQETSGGGRGERCHFEETA